MVGLNPVDITIKLTCKEQTALLQYCSSLNTEMRLMLFSAQDGLLVLSAGERIHLRQAIEAELDRISNDKAADTLGRLYNKLSSNPVMSKIGEQISSMDFESIEDMQAEADKIMHRHNNSPDRLLGGLSPVHAHQLLYTEWGKTECPMKLNGKLEFDNVRNAPLYENSLIFLDELKKLENENTATAKGNLTRKAVKNIASRLNLDNDDITKHLIQTSKRLNEQEIVAVWMIRLICQLAGLVKKNRNKFLVTKRALLLMAPENAGDLYNLLFLTYMRKFKIGFFGRLPEIDGLQSTMAYTIYHLWNIADNEIRLDESYRKLILPAVMEEVDYIAKGLIHPSFIIRQRVIEPLEYAGLLDCKREKVKLFPEIVSVRVSQLFKRYISFEM